MGKKESCKKRSIVKRISITNIIVFGIACAISIFVILKLNIEHHIDNDAKMMKIYISNTLSSVDNTLKDMGRVSLIAFSDSTVQEILKGRNDTFYENKNDNEYLTKLYSSMISIRDDVKGIYIFNKEEMLFYNDTANPFLGFEWNVASFFDEVKNNSDLSADISGCHMYVETLPEGFQYKEVYKNDIFQKNNIYLVRPIRNFSPFEIIGYIALRTPIQTLKNICDNYLEDGISYLIADENNTIACSSKEEIISNSLWDTYPDLLLNLNGSKGSFSITMDRIKYLCAYQRSEYSDMLLITLKPYEMIYKEINILVITCIGVFLISAMTILGSVWILTRKNLKRLTEFSIDLQNFQPDDLTRHYDIGCMDEVGMLKDSFNKMIERLNELVISEYQARDELQKAEISEQKMAMLYLKQQINPHFLYNTIDMIRLKAAINKDEEVSQMLMKLVSFYRLSTKVDSAMVTVYQEVSMLEAYMGLICYRYPDVIYKSKVSENVWDMEIPNFILQPLLENSLMHGLKDRRYRGSITLRIEENKKNEKEIMISIIDDGVGIPESKLQELNSYSSNGNNTIYRLENEKQEERTHLGVINVISRLKLYYQEDCEIVYAKNKSGGTTVTIKLKTVSEEI